MSTVAETAPRIRSARPIACWLIATALMTVLMVVIGGITRLTESGLSITEWNLVAGILPPLGPAAWHDAFAKYQQIPEYRQVHYGITLEQFKEIYFWEYLHRLCGRLTGLVALAPPLALLAMRRMPGALAPRYLAVPLLVALQGALGWYMVESGLAVRTSVSQYRLTAHLCLALALYGYCVWQAAELLGGAPLRLAAGGLRRGALGLLGLVATTIIAGGFTAGTKAGYVYNSFPLMGGHLVPQGYFAERPWWRNPFENVAAVQFDHRLLATATVVAVALFWGAAYRSGLRRRARLPVDLMLAAVALQAGLGIATLLLVVPIPLAAAHQAGAVVLLTATLLTAHRFTRGAAALGRP